MGQFDSFAFDLSDNIDNFQFYLSCTTEVDVAESEFSSGKFSAKIDAVRLIIDKVAKFSESGNA